MTYENEETGWHNGIYDKFNLEARIKSFRAEEEGWDSQMSCEIYDDSSFPIN